MAPSTREKLLEATASLLASEGLSGVSARTIAARAEVNQALVFYHFGTVSELLEAAVRQTVDLAVASYQDRFRDVDSVAGLLALGRDLQQTEQSRGNVAQMAHVLAGAQTDEALARAGRYALQRWSDEIEGVLTRLLPGSPLEGVLEPAGLARVVAAGAIGLELYAGVDEAGAAQAQAALDSLAALIQAVDDLGPVTTRAVRGRVRKATVKASAKTRSPR